MFKIANMYLFIKSIFGARLNFYQSVIEFVAINKNITLQTKIKKLCLKLSVLYLTYKNNKDYAFNFCVSVLFY